MSLCDSCYSPGACCKRMQLFNSEYPTGFTFWDDTPVAEQTKNWESFPFEATEKDETQIDPDSGRSFSTWFFSCPNLRSDGRCGDYENRPDICHRFEPASNALCVHYQGAEGTGDGL